MVDSISEEEEDEALLRFDEPGTARAVVLEDDGKVAYAYLLEAEEVVGDVWLYNVGEAPDQVDWKDVSQAPFLNPKQFCKADQVPRLKMNSNVVCKWLQDGVEVSVDGVLLARLKRGETPGSSRLAASPGPLARPLV